MLLLGLQSHVGDVAAIKTIALFSVWFLWCNFNDVGGSGSNGDPGPLCHFILLSNEWLFHGRGWMDGDGVIVFKNARAVFVVCLRTVVVEGEPLKYPINAIPPHRNVLRSPLP